MTDHNPARVLEGGPERATEAAVALWASLPEPQRKKVMAASMDMGAGFAAATRQAAPQATIEHDRFHASKHLNEAVDKVRRDEHRRLLEKGDESLKHTTFLWLQGVLVEGDQSMAFVQFLARELKTAKAWAFKEAFVEFWSQPDGLRAKLFFELWHDTVIRSKLDPLKKVARMLQSHLSGLLNYFDHPITNAITEGFNSRIQSLKAASRGFRRFTNYRTRILFCGKLDLAPHLPLSPCH